MERMAAAAASENAPPSPAVGPADEMPPEYWQAVLDDASGGGGPPSPPIRTQRLSEVARHLLRVSCRRCGRTVEIQMVDAARLYGPDAMWKDVGQRLLDNTCTQRTGVTRKTAAGRRSSSRRGAAGRCPIWKPGWPPNIIRRPSPEAAVRLSARNSARRGGARRRPCYSWPGSRGTRGRSEDGLRCRRSPSLGTVATLPRPWSIRHEA